MFNVISRETSLHVTVMENVSPWRKDVTNFQTVKTSLMKMIANLLFFLTTMSLTMLLSLSTSLGFSSRFLSGLRLFCMRFLCFYFILQQMDLISILGIDEVEQKLKAQFNLYISWFDFRLKFWNMKQNINMNTLTQDEKRSIWVPVLVFRE